MKFNRRQRFAVYGGLFMSTAAFMALVNGGSVGALSTSPTTGAAVAADPTSSTAATATTASTASTTSTTAGPTSTTAGPTTTTTVGTQQTTVSGKSSDTNKCHTVLVPALLPPSDGTTPISISATAFPQPHKGDPIKLTKTSVTITTAGSTFDQGVGVLFSEGSKVPSSVTLVMAGSGTTEGTHKFTFNTTAVLHIVNGHVQDIVGTTALPDTTWHPKNANDPVIFSEKSITLVASIDASKIKQGTIKGTNTCAPAGPATVVAVSAQGEAVPPVTTGSTAPTGVTVAAATTTTVAAAANTLPRTGASGVYLIIIGAALLNAGAALLLMTRRRRA